MSNAYVKAGHIPTLDGLRALAILIVIASHAFHQNHSIAGLGHMGVMIFFALSGYLITTRLLDECGKNGRISLRKFYVRRAFRILPPALAYLAALAVLSAAGVVVCSSRSIVAALLFYVNYIDVGEIGWRAGHFWSLSVEEHFYLLWPLALIVFGVRKGLRTALALTVGIILWRATDNHFHLLEHAFGNPYLHWNSSGTDAIADTLLWGCALAFFKLRLKASVSMAIAVSSAAMLALISMGLVLGSTELTLTVEHVLPAVMLGAIAASPQNLIGRFLELSSLRFIGHLSYSLYIWQQLFLGGPGHKLPLLLGLAAAFACAYASYRWIEKPAIELGRTWLQTRRAPPTQHHQAAEQ
jgi:peptidoglycan/LPS O-acetylase OafA/YrhL